MVNITTQPSTTPVTESTVQPPSYHTGGGYSESAGYTPAVEQPIEQLPTDTTDGNSIEDIMNETSTSIDDIIKGNKYTKIPTSTTPIKKPTSKSGGSAVIPIAAGLSAAAAAGIGAKAYIDRKNNSDNGDDEEEFEDDWSEGTSTIDYADNIENTDEEEKFLSDDDMYEEEKYGARSSEELTDLQ